MMNLLGSLGCLYQQLMQARDQGSCTVLPDGVEPTRWEDEEFVYFEVGLPEAKGEFMDICIHQGSAFVRIAKVSAEEIFPHQTEGYRGIEGRMEGLSQSK